MFPPQGIAALLKEALVVYKGTTTSAGAADGSTLVCSALTAKADWNGNQIIITSGDYDGQARDINGTTALGTVTPAEAFGGQIVAGVTFVITGIRTVPAEVEELTTDVMGVLAVKDMPGSVFYVKSDGDDTNDGTTWAKAVKTIDYAVGLCTAKKGDTIFVAPGDYDEKANGAAGVTVDKSTVSIIGVSSWVGVTNTSTANNGYVFNITASMVRLIDLNVRKGETTSTGAALINLAASAYGPRLYGITMNVEKTGFTGIKLANGSYGAKIRPGILRKGLIYSANSVGTGIDCDQSQMVVGDIQIRDLEVGVELGANSDHNLLGPNLIVSDCAKGVHLTAGANENVIACIQADCTESVDDDSGNATNETHSSLTHIHDDIAHIPKRSGVTYYVDGTNGLDTNSGHSPSEALATIGAAIAALSVGDDIMVMAKPAKYIETGLDLNVQGTTLEFEQGAILKAASGDVLTVSVGDCTLKNVFIDNDVVASRCFVVSAVSAHLIGCIAMEGSVGFAIDANKCVLQNCYALVHSVTGFDVKSKYGIYMNCVANGNGAAVRGFYLTDNTADMNTFINCHTLNNTTAGWAVVAGADQNAFTRCSMGGTDGAKVDAGTNNSWITWRIGSQIVAGQSIDEDLEDIYEEVNASALAQGGGSVASNAHVDSLVRAMADVVRAGGSGDLAAILADVTGINGEAMRGTNNAALAATALTNATWTDALAGYIANINNANLATIPDISGINTTNDTQIKFAAAGSKTIASGAEKYLSIDSGTNGAEIISITVKGVVGADWTIETYIPAEDAIAAPAAGDKRDEDTYLNGEDKGGQLTNIGAIRYNMFLDVTNDSGGSDNIDEVIVAYRSAGTLSLAWEA